MDLNRKLDMIFGKENTRNHIAKANRGYAISEPVNAG
tara:strand:+ start:44 stop:154 length:111 start_codon:yes stop_codon:yes gene_type:complete